MLKALEHDRHRQGNSQKYVHTLLYQTQVIPMHDIISISRYVITLQGKVHHQPAACGQVPTERLRQEQRWQLGC